MNVIYSSWKSRFTECFLRVVEFLVILLQIFAKWCKILPTDNWIYLWLHWTHSSSLYWCKNSLKKAKRRGVGKTTTVLPESPSFLSLKQRPALAFLEFLSFAPGRAVAVLQQTVPLTMMNLFDANFWKIATKFTFWQWRGLICQNEVAGEKM